MHRVAGMTIWFFVYIMLYGCTPTTDLKPSDVNMTESGYLKSIKLSIAAEDLESADKKYLSFRGKYIESKLIADAIFLLSAAHIENQEYLLARFYADAYISEYPDGKRLDNAWFLRVKSTFERFKNSNSDDEPEKSFARESQEFLNSFSHSKYRKDIKELQKEFYTIRKKRYEKIAELYERIDKPKAAEFYRKKIER